jgi:hypothetical protein
MKRRWFLGEVMAGVAAVLTNPVRLLARPAPAARPGTTRPPILRVGRVDRNPETGGIEVSGWCMDGKDLRVKEGWTIDELADVSRNPAQ